MKYEVVAVGAGPAGSTAAKFLAENGIKVLLVDKSKFPRDKACGGGLTPRVLDRFRYVKDKNLIESYSFGGIAHSPSLKYESKFERPESSGSTVLRKKFDFGLLNLAIDAGCNFIDENPVKDLKISKNKVEIDLKSGDTIKSQIVIGADGTWSKIGRSIRLNRRPDQILTCIVQEFKIGEEIINEFFTEKKFSHIYFGRGGLSGYGWIFPKREHLNIGLGGEIFRDNLKLRDLADIFKQYIKLLKDDKKIPSNLKIEKCKASFLPTSPLKKTYDNRVILCGDAGGFVNPFTGEGIYFAMSSGQIAARVITEALDVGDTSEAFLSEYQSEWEKDFGMDIKVNFFLKYFWRKKFEKFIRISSKDEKFTEMLMGTILGWLDSREYKWRIIRRYLWDNLRLL